MYSTSSDARQSILQSIRSHLAESARIEPLHEPTAAFSENQGAAYSDPGDEPNVLPSRVAMFCERLEAVGGHCVVATDKAEAARALAEIVSALQSSIAATRIALSDAPLLSELVSEKAFAGTQICPPVSDLFSYDVGITTAQAAIAETGTLILESEQERHRLVSLLPPVHIAVIRSADICLTIGDALQRLHANGDAMSRAITFITGPSRTADIELTLTVGVHGPKELYVIVLDNEEIGPSNSITV